MILSVRKYLLIVTQLKIFSAIPKFSDNFLYSQHRVLAIEDLFQGIIDGAAVYRREEIKPCPSQNTAPVNLGSKLPIESGGPEPGGYCHYGKIKVGT